eukprot:4497907-Pleurochrysis_carterae.AAC.1
MRRVASVRWRTGARQRFVGRCVARLRTPETTAESINGVDAFHKQPIQSNCTADFGRQETMAKAHLSIP